MFTYSEFPQPSSGNCPCLPNLFSLWRKAKKTNKDSPPWQRLCRRFTLEELRTATDNFQSKIGENGFVNLYKGFIKDSYKDTVAIRRFVSSQQHEYFMTEMELLSNLQYHPNIISLIGYCLDGSNSDKFIVYEYMPRGTLHDLLHNRNDFQPLLSWKKRLEICIGVARGLEFLHTGNNPSIIHRDIKTRNILLDQNWVAKISDFELSKLMVPTSLSESDSHVTTRIVGTMGYIDPEYMRAGYLTKKSDVYSFGVVLFEVLSARKPWDRYLEEGQGLTRWCRDCVEDGRVDEIIDPLLKDEIAPDCLKAYVDMAYKCTNERTDERPTMDAVVKRLELTLSLQECVEADIPFSPSWLQSIVPPPKRSNTWFEMEVEHSELSESDYDVDDLLR
ncbi:hypothetical protein PTKIN_Ptkin09bG0278100 [Pterospermum kingtungense]